MDIGDESRNPIEAELADQLRRAVVAGELVAYYQPQYDLANGEIAAFEALCRWRHPLYGLLPPARFIDIAERHGLIAEVDRYMFEQSGRTILDWHRRGARAGMSINVSPSELSPGLAETILQWVKDGAVPRRALTVEITESPAILYSRSEVFALETLIDGGVGVSIDDFGTDRASLELVAHLPLTEVKIDKALVQDPARAIDELVHVCVDIARERNAVVVAEGVETPDHVERVTRWTCDRAQGHYFSPPLPVEEAEPLLLGAA